MYIYVYIQTLEHQWLKTCRAARDVDPRVITGPINDMAERESERTTGSDPRRLDPPVFRVFAPTRVPIPLASNSSSRIYSRECAPAIKCKPARTAPKGAEQQLRGARAPRIMTVVRGQGRVLSLSPSLSLFSRSGLWRKMRALVACVVVCIICVLVCITAHSIPLYIVYNTRRIDSNADNTR